MKRVMLVVLCAFLLGVLFAEATRNPIVQVERSTAGQIRLSWNLVPDATCYNIYKATTLLTPSDPDWQFFANTTATSYTFYSNSPREFYCIRSIDTPFTPVNLIFVERPGDNFFMGMYETTQAEYYSIMGTNPSYFTGNPNRPVETVTYYNMVEYCNRRSIQEGYTPCFSYGTYGTDPANWPAGWNSNFNGISWDYSANGYRLPSQSEWKYAASGGYEQNQTYPYVYSGSNNIYIVGWFLYNAGWGLPGQMENPAFGPHSVGTKAHNQLGFHDMTGNVSEVCIDGFGSYRYLCGGHFGCPENQCEVYGGTIGDILNFVGWSVGFRVIRKS